MKREINLFDTVALLEDLPERNLHRGEVGTVVAFPPRIDEYGILWSQLEPEPNSGSRV